MTNKDSERDAANNDDDVSQKSVESLPAESMKPQSEIEPLLSGSNNGVTGYKSTETVTSEDARSEDEGSPQEQPTSKSVFAVIGLLLIGVFISNADGTLVLATYGTISSEFGALGDASWLTTSYSLAVCAMQPIVGKLSDIYGRKGVLLTSYALFGIGSVICGNGQSMWQVIVGRIVSGLGAAGMTVIVSVLITDLVPLIQVAAWRSYVNVVSTLGRSIGGPLGGLLADTIGWRWSFLGQGPLILLAIMLVALKLPSRSSTDQVQQKGQPSKLRRIDFIGAFMLALTIVALLGALSLCGQNLSWSHPIVIGLTIGAVVLGCLFVTYETKYALEPVFPPTLVIRRDVATPYAIVALQIAAQLAMMYSIPLYFRVTQNSTNTAAGAHLFPAVLGNTVGGLLTGFIIQQTGRYKTLIILATTFSSLTYSLLIIRWHGRTSFLESLEIIPGGFGTGMAGSATFIALTSSLEHKDVAMATGGMYLSNTVGNVIGIAVSSAVQVGTLKRLLVKELEDVPGSRRIIREVVSNVSSIRRLDEPIRRIVVESYVRSLEYSHMVSLGYALLALLIACTVQERSLR